VAERNENIPSYLKLKRFLESRAKPRTEERCEFCGAEIPGRHSHAVNVESRALLCACRACWLLFTREGAARGKYRAVPERYLYIREPVFTDGQWDELQVPVGMAFFFFNSSLGRAVAFYPSPAGATESLLPLETWKEVVRVNPLLDGLAPDVEALLVYKRREGSDCYVAPIDACYELVGRIRRHWKGFDGGEEARLEIDDFFEGLRAKSEEASGSKEWAS
jgi:hypothetical protein